MPIKEVVLKGDFKLGISK